MNFYQKHTYLIWQLIGWGLVLAAFIVLLVNLNDYNHDYILGSVVFLTMFGTFAIFVSPLVIWLRKRDKAEQERNRCIIELHSKLHPVQEVISVLIVITVFFAATIAIERLGLFFLFPLGFYLAAEKFYQIPDAEKYCQTFELTQPEGLELFEQAPAFAYFGIVPDDKTLRFIYNFYRKCGSLRQEQSLRLVHVTYGMMNRRYGTLFQNADEGFWCVSSEDVDINKYTEICYYSRMTIYEGWLRALLE